MLLELRRRLRKKFYSDMRPSASQASVAPLNVNLAGEYQNARYLYRLFISRFQIAKLESGVANVIERHRYDPFNFNRINFTI